MAVVRSCSCIPPERTDGSLCFLDHFTLSPLHTLGGEGGFVYTRLMGVLFFLLSLPIRAEQLHYRRFWSELDGTTQGCMF